MTVRLRGDRGGDPLDPPRRANDPDRERVIEIEKIAPRLHTHRAPDSGFITQETRERLREIIMRSPNPRKCLAYFQSKSDSFLKQSNRIDGISAQIKQIQRGSIEVDSASPTPAPVMEDFSLRAIPVDTPPEQVSDPIVEIMVTSVPIVDRQASMLEVRTDNAPMETALSAINGEISDTGTYCLKEDLKMRVKAITASELSLSVVESVSCMASGGWITTMYKPQPMKTKITAVIEFKTEHAGNVHANDLLNMNLPLLQLDDEPPDPGEALFQTKHSHKGAQHYQRMCNRPKYSLTVCLRSDDSLLQELRAETMRMTAPFLKEKGQLLGKRPGCKKVMMKDAEQTLSGRLRQNSEKKDREVNTTEQVGEKTGGEDADLEATSLGAAGTLTGAKERTCQEP